MASKSILFSSQKIFSATLPFLLSLLQLYKLHDFGDFLSVVVALQRGELHHKIPVARVKRSLGQAPESGNIIPASLKFEGGGGSKKNSSDLVVGSFP